MFTVCVDVVFGDNYVEFYIICSLQYSININTVEVDPHSDSLQNGIAKPKNVFLPEPISISRLVNCFSHG